MPTHKPVMLTVANLQAIVGELVRTTEGLRLRVETLSLDGIKAIEVTNHDQLTRALEYLENFSHATRKAHIKLRDKSGAFGGDSKRKKGGSDGGD